MISEYVEKKFDADAKGCWPPEAVGTLAPGVLRVLYVGGVPEMCEYLCPCGCGSPCPTYFQTARRKRTPERHLWDFLPGPTLVPSVRHLSGCRSHYNITDGKVIMHGDSGK